MKNFNSVYKATALGVAMVFGTSVLMMNGCKNPAQDIKVAIATKTLSKSATLVQFVKANPNGPALPVSIPVTIGGPGKDFVQTDNGGKDFVASNGLLPLSLNRFSAPSAASPIVFTISANVAGYAPVFQKITISSDADLKNAVIPLVSLATPPAGAAVVQNDKPLTGGTSVAETKIETTVSAGTPQAVELTLPAGTQMQDANKQPIAASSLKTTMIYYGTTNADALQAAAPIMTAVDPIGPNNTPIPGNVSFITAGAVSINMTAGNTAVKNFSKAISAEIEINPELINPTTGAKIKAGDVVPVWSLDEGNGQWRFEYNATVTTSGGKLVAVINITHLSTWALNFFTTTTCPFTVTINLGADVKNYAGYIVKYEHDGQTMAVLAAELSTSAPAGTTSIQIKNPVPAAFKGRVVVYASSGTTLTKIAESPTLSNCNDFTLNVPAPAFTDFVDTDISFVAKCTNKNIIAYPTTWMSLKDITDGTAVNVHMINGKVNAKLKNGHSYTMSAVYDEKTYTSETVVIDRTKAIAISNAAGLKVSGAYNSGTKKMALDAEFVVTDCK
jgi:hypothetical protein